MCRQEMGNVRSKKGKGKGQTERSDGTTGVANGAPNAERCFLQKPLQTLQCSHGSASVCSDVSQATCNSEVRRTSSSSSSARSDHVQQRTPETHTANIVRANGASINQGVDHQQFLEYHAKKDRLMMIVDTAVRQTAREGAIAISAV